MFWNSGFNCWSYCTCSRSPFCVYTILVANLCWRTVLWYRSAAVSYQGTQCDFSSVTMICDLSGVTGRGPLHVNKPAAAVAPHPLPPLVCVVDHKPTTHISSPSPTCCPLQIFDFLIFNIMMKLKAWLGYGFQSEFHSFFKISFMWWLIAILRGHWYRSLFWTLDVSAQGF